MSKLPQPTIVQPANLLVPLRDRHRTYMRRAGTHIRRSALGNLNSAVQLIRGADGNVSDFTKEAMLVVAVHYLKAAAKDLRSVRAYLGRARKFRIRAAALEAMGE